MSRKIRYSWLLAHYPWVVIAAVCVLATVCMVVIVVIGEKPDFRDPKLGFESRGTEISNRLHSYERLLEATISNRMEQVRTYISLLPGPQSHANVTYRRPAVDSWQEHGDEDDDDDGEESHTSGDGIMIGQDSFFCDAPREAYSRVVFQGVDEANLFTADMIKSMCLVEQARLRNHASFSESCIRRTISQQCCRSWSLGNYVALLSDKASCLDVSQEDVDAVHQTLQTCAAYYTDMVTVHGCYDAHSNSYHLECQNIPQICQTNNTFYYLFHYILDSGFLQKDANRGVEKELHYAMTILPLAAGIGAQPLYEDIKDTDLSSNTTKIIGIHFGIKQALFDHYLRTDTVWLAVALASILVAMLLYTASFVMTVVSIVSLFVTLEISYFVYTMVFEISFVPFMTLLAVVILIGVGTDDVFIYCHAWNVAKRDASSASSVQHCVSSALKHAALSMFVTSFTTAAALYANYYSSITALQCFGLFAGTVILVNLLMMLTFLPAVIVLLNRWRSCCCTTGQVRMNDDSHRTGFSRHIHTVCCKVPNMIEECSRKVFEELLPKLIIKGRFIWVSVFGTLGVGAVVVVFYYPGLRLASSDELQLFEESHPFEVYDLRLKNWFWFEKTAQETTIMMPITVVWGVKPVDNGDHLDPFSEGTIVYDETFDISNKESQSWLFKFCRDLRISSFYQRQSGWQLTNCFIEHYRKYLQRACSGMYNYTSQPCCGISQFPFESDTFTHCIGQWLQVIQMTPTNFYHNSDAGLRFSKETGKLVSVVVDFNSQIPFSLSYGSMAEFYESLNGWVNDQLLTAPVQMRGGWFVSQLSFFDLQKSIAEGTPIAIAVSIGVASAVAFITTLNIFVTLYAMLCITGGIFVTVAALVLLGWQLNVLEAFTILVAVGLSIDFTLHYGMAYTLSPHLSRQTRVMSATAKMGSPVAMAALTTFIAGALMMPSTVLAYRKLGTFLMIVMAVSWVYATFFFQSLLKMIGPPASFGQLHWPSQGSCCRKKKDEDECLEDTAYVPAPVSSSSSSSSSNVSISNTAASGEERHELQPLTHGGERKGKRMADHNVWLALRGMQLSLDSSPTPSERSSTITLGGSGSVATRLAGEPALCLSPGQSLLAAGPTIPQYDAHTVASVGGTDSQLTSEGPGDEANACRQQMGSPLQVWAQPEGGLFESDVSQ